MCGFVGFYSKEEFDPLKKKLTQALSSIQYRGPDNTGSDFTQHVGFGHVRLSIIDLTDGANQPIYSKSNSSRLIYNGELYNFLSIKKQLIEKGVLFRTNSDTEVVLESLENDFMSAIESFNGMFSFAFHDIKGNRLILARDRFGIKPLYYYQDDANFYFGSEIKTLRVLCSENLQINEDVFAEWSYYGSSLGDRTFYKGVKKLLPGHYLVYDLLTGLISVQAYWKPECISQNIVTSADSVISKTQQLLRRAVESQLVSDVPVGVFLSGGIDSSAITAFAAPYYGNNLKTFSVGFDFDKGVNELAKAKIVAEKFGTEHHEFNVNGYDLVSTIEALVNHHDSPFSDAANIPLYLLSQSVAQDVKVVLQGDGGDELFAGYRRYNTLSRIKLWRLLSPILSTLNYLSPRNESYYSRARYLRALCSTDDAKLMALLLTAEDLAHSPLKILSDSLCSKIEKLDPFEEFRKCNNRFSHLDIVQRMLYTDTQIILPDIFLEKVDRSTMAASIEVRVPFLDNDLTNYVMSLPSSYKVNSGEQKYLLKQCLLGILPDNILNGPKTGFGVPYKFWLTDALKDYFYGLLDSLGTDHPYINTIECRRLLDLHGKSGRDNGFMLWKALNLCIWIKNQEFHD